MWTIARHVIGAAAFLLAADDVQSVADETIALP